MIVSGIFARNPAAICGASCCYPRPSSGRKAQGETVVQCNILRNGRIGGEMLAILCPDLFTPRRTSLLLVS